MSWSNLPKMVYAIHEIKRGLLNFGVEEAQFEK